MRSGLQMGCLIAGILCLLYYMAIVLYAGITADFAWIWAFGGGFLLLVSLGLRYLGRNPETWLRWPLRAAGVLSLIAVLLFVYIGSHIAAGIFAKPVPHMDYVIVLGAQVRGSTVSKALRKRLDCAAEYAIQNPETKFILSGGQGAGEDITEAEAMYRYLTEEKGVAANRLQREDRSTSTKENLEFSSELTELHNKKVGIISNDFHVYRAGQMAKKQGYQKISLIPAASDWGMQPHYILREVCAVLLAVYRNDMSI